MLSSRLNVIPGLIYLAIKRWILSKTLGWTLPIKWNWSWFIKKAIAHSCTRANGNRKNFYLNEEHRDPGKNYSRRLNFYKKVQHKKGASEAGYKCLWVRNEWNYGSAEFEKKVNQRNLNKSKEVQKNEQRSLNWPWIN